MAASSITKSKMMFITVMMLFMTSVDGFSGASLHSSSSRATPTLLHVFGRGGNSRGKTSPLLEEALEAYPFNFQPDNKVSDKKLFAPVTQKQATICFNELARLYGDEESLKMVRIQPRILSFRSDFFEPCLEAWTEQFGLEASQAMVRRNPGLLGVNPILAKEPAEASMALSYLVAVTRPLPKLIAVGGLLAIATAGIR